MIIPYFNDRMRLLKCLDSLMRRAEGSFEIIVVDDGSEAPLVFEEACLKKNAVHLIRMETNRGPAAARNAGARLAQGRVLLFTDSDCVPMDDWVQKTVEQLNALRAQDPVTVALCGRMKSTADFIGQCHMHSNYAYVQSGVGRRIEYLNTSCAAVMTEDFHAVGGFSEDLRVGEDPELALKLVERGGRIFYTPDVHIFHDHGIHAFNQMIEKNYRMGFAHGLGIYRKHPRRYRGLLRALDYLPSHLLLIFPLALTTTWTSIRLNFRTNLRVLGYAPVILLNKIAFRWGIFSRVARDRKSVKEAAA